MQAFELANLLQQQASEKPYLEFLQVPDLSCGLYVLPAGGVDQQQPHSEDEVYFVVNSRSHITIDSETRPVQPGSIIYVAAHVPHRFHDITEDLQILVFFAPAEGSKR